MTDRNGDLGYMSGRRSSFWHRFDRSDNFKVAPSYQYWFHWEEDTCVDHSQSKVISPQSFWMIHLDLVSIWRAQNLSHTSCKSLHQEFSAFSNKDFLRGTSRIAAEKSLHFSSWRDSVGAAVTVTNVLYYEHAVLCMIAMIARSWDFEWWFELWSTCCHLQSTSLSCNLQYPYTGTVNGIYLV